MLLFSHQTTIVLWSVWLVCCSFGSDESDITRLHVMTSDSHIRTNNKHQNMKSNNGRHTTIVGENSGIVLDESDLRVIVKYKNSKGHQAALEASSHVYYHYPNDRYIVIDCSSSLDLNDLSRNENVESIEHDSIWTHDGSRDEFVTKGSQRTKEPEEVVMELNDIQVQILPPTTTTVTTTVTTSTTNVDGSFGVASSVVSSIPFGISMIQADQVSYGSSNATVCIVDTGSTPAHPLFTPDLISGADRYSSRNASVLLKWNKDVQGHGTHISGIVSARADVPSFASVRGVGAGTIPLFITRGIDDTGKARESDIREAMVQCERAQAKVINLSLSGSSITTLLQSYIDYLYDVRDILLVAASGNDGIGTNRFPAAYNRVVAVGAVYKSEKRWEKSNYGPYLELMAPGVGITSAGFTYTGQFALSVYTGTSMAAPHVAGAAALLFSHFPDCTPTQIRYVLAVTAKDDTTTQPGTGCDSYYGYGIVQVKKAYDFLSKYSCISTKSKWGKIIGNGMCSAIDVPPPQPQPIQHKERLSSSLRKPLQRLQRFFRHPK